MSVTRRQEHILLHMTGLDRSNEPYRNHFATDEGTTDWDDLLALVAAGHVRPPVKGQEVFGGLSFFYVTESGLAEAKRLAASR